MSSVLVNFVYAQPVGHAIEALQYCLGYHAADPSRRIGVVLNAATPAELATWCPFIDEVHTIRLDLFDPATDARDQLEAIGDDWDHVVSDVRSGRSRRSASSSLAWPPTTTRPTPTSPAPRASPAGSRRPTGLGSRSGWICPDPPREAGSRSCSAAARRGTCTRRSRPGS
jgi:hypothetical protein